MKQDLNKKDTHEKIKFKSVMKEVGQTILTRMLSMYDHDIKKKEHDELEKGEEK